MIVLEPLSDINTKVTTHLFPIPLAIIHACENINIETVRIAHHHSATLSLYQNSNN